MSKDDSHFSTEVILSCLFLFFYENASIDSVDISIFNSFRSPKTINFVESFVFSIRKTYFNCHIIVVPVYMNFVVTVHCFTEYTSLSVVIFQGSIMRVYLLIILTSFGILCHAAEVLIMPSSLFPVHRFTMRQLAEELVNRNHTVMWVEYGLEKVLLFWMISIICFFCFIH